MAVNKYFMVHKTKGNTTTSVVHPTKHDAEVEAIRLAKLNPGTIYTILEVVGAFCTMDNPVIGVEVIGETNGL